MNERRPSEIVAAVAFLAVICGVPLLHAVTLWRAGKPHPLAALLSHPPTEAHLRAVEKKLERGDTASAAARPWVRAAEYAVLRNAGKTLLAGRDGWLFYAPGVEAATRRPQRGNPDPGEAAVAASGFRDALAARGIHLLVVPVPNKESIHSEFLWPFPAPEVSPDAAGFLADCRRRGVVALDLFEPFRRLARDTPVYLARDTHWTPAGVGEAARCAAGEIIARGWLPARRPIGPAKPIDVAREGDLFEMLESPPLGAALPPQVVTINQYPPAPGPAEIVVIGDSFLRIYETDSPRHAGFSSQLGSLLGVSVATLAEDGGGSTLARQSLARHATLLKAAKVVVWVFVERDLRLGVEGWRDVPLPAASPGP